MYLALKLYPFSSKCARVQIWLSRQTERFSSDIGDEGRTGQKTKQEKVEAFPGGREVRWVSECGEVLAPGIVRLY